MPAYASECDAFRARPNCPGYSLPRVSIPCAEDDSQRPTCRAVRFNGHHRRGPSSAASTDDGASCPSTGDTDESAGTFFLPTASIIGADTTSSRTDATTSPEASPVRPVSPPLSSPAASSSPPLTNTEPTPPAEEKGSRSAALAAPVDDDGPSYSESRPRAPTPAPAAEGTGELTPRNPPLLLAAAEDAQACQPAVTLYDELTPVPREYGTKRTASPKTA
nr:uncharacterized protein LOC129382846 [Dermacentor andersoni]